MDDPYRAFNSLVLGPVRDIVENLVRTGMRSNIPIVRESYAKKRRILVDYTSEGGERFGFKPRTTHLAVNLMDRILNEVPMEVPRLQLVAVTCLWIAAKYEENDTRLPSVESLINFASQIYNAELIFDMESKILHGLDFRVGAPTAIHLLEPMLNAGVIFPGDAMIDRSALITRLPTYVKKYSLFFADLSLQENIFTFFPAPILAVAIILCSRRALRITPVWRDELSLMCLLTFNQVAKCYETLFEHYCTSFPDKAEELAIAEAQAESPDGVEQIDSEEDV